MSAEEINPEVDAAWNAEDVTRDDVREALRALAKVTDKDTPMLILKEYGHATALSKLKERYYGIVRDAAWLAVRVHLTSDAYAIEQQTKKVRRKRAALIRRIAEIDGLHLGEGDEFNLAHSVESQFDELAQMEIALVDLKRGCYR